MQEALSDLPAQERAASELRIWRQARKRLTVRLHRAQADAAAVRASMGECRKVWDAKRVSLEVRAFSAERAQADAQQSLERAEGRSRDLLEELTVTQAQVQDQRDTHQAQLHDLRKSSAQLQHDAALFKVSSSARVREASSPATALLLANKWQSACKPAMQGLRWSKEHSAASILQLPLHCMCGSKITLLWRLIP